MPPRVNPFHFSWTEAVRLALLALVAAWLLHPFATSRRIGSGDALWYANMLADFVSQWRAGFFPVFAGQTEYAFNGAVYPLRVAPLYQHLAGAIDLLTGRQLGWFTLQHLCVIACGAAGIFGCYLALCATTPGRRWSAAVLAILYLSCPGVLGIVFTQDLYMSWMTVPFVPLVFYGVVRSFQRNDWVAQVCMAASLALMWLGHSPIALWATLLAAGMQAVRLLLVHRSLRGWRLALLGAAIFAALAQYPFVSLSTLASTGSATSTVSGLPNESRIFKSVQESFPGSVLPVSHTAGSLSDLQLGYGLWLVLAAVVLVSGGGGTWETRVLVAGSGGLLLLLLPVPGVTAWLWTHAPSAVKRITYYWPMQRFYLLVAGMLAFAAQLAFARWSATRWRHAKTALLAAACVWSLVESRRFVEAARTRTASPVISERAQRPENILLMNHAYGLFAALPAYFSNGVMDPSQEIRLLDRTTLVPLPVPGAKIVSTGWLEGVVDENPGILKLAPTLHLAAGRHYRLVLGFSARDYEGILALAGREMQREYSLPKSGEALAFGSAPANSSALPLWTTAPDGDEITLRFIPTAPKAKPLDFASFAHFSLEEIDPLSAAITVVSLMPLRLVTKAERAAWLETPRMYAAGYRAAVDEAPVTPSRSPQLLTMIPVEPGTHVVELRYVGPPLLRWSYGLALGAWSLLLLVPLGAALRRSRFTFPTT